MEILETIGKIKKGILDVLFPALCGGCGKEGAYICETCSVFLGEAPLICPVCNVSSFGGTRHAYCESRYGLDGLASVWEYEGVMKHLLGQIKYARVTHPIEELVERAFAAMAKDQQRFAPFLSFLFAKDTVLTFVPIFLRKEKSRGFNQAQLIAKEIGRVTGRQVFPLLRKARDTQSQTELDKEQRLQNMKDAFQAKFEIRSTKSETNSNPPTGGQVQKQIVLVDDIWTTGATMRECCKELKKAGVGKVWGFTLARTV